MVLVMHTAPAVNIKANADNIKMLCSYLVFLCNLFLSSHKTCNMYHKLVEY